jgi:AbrB family looped-hinge helix DNA binding protein
MVYAIIDGMTIKIDKAGRIVLPKPVRERFRLRAGSDLELEERPEGLILRPVEQGPSMIQEHGIWVHLGKAPRGFDWSTVVDAFRDDRLKDASGL